MCANAYVCSSVTDSVVWGHCWIDRFAKVVMQFPIFARVLEIWPPAQQDSDDSGCAASWQPLSDGSGIDGVLGSPHFLLPFLAIGAPWSDPPMVMLYHDVLVFDRSAFFDVLYDRVLSGQSVLASDFQRLGYDSSVSRAVCESADILLGQHRMATYLRSVDYLPRVFFSVPACRCYGLPEGTSVAHVSVCSQLYPPPLV